MRRITYSRELIPDTFGAARGVFYKDGIEFARIPADGLNDMFYFPRHPYNTEVFNIIKQQLNDPTLDDELLAVLRETFPAVEFNV
jgi:hypothetical protein